MKNKRRTKYTILGMLTINPMSGYEISKMIHTSTAHFWSESEGQLYPTLAECVKLGLITCKDDPLNKTQRAKKIYKITAKGKKTLVEWLREKPLETLVRNEFLLKLFFGGNVDSEINIKHIENYQEETNQQLDLYLKLREESVLEQDTTPHAKHWLILIDYGINAAKAELSWCQETLKVLRK